MSDTANVSQMATLKVPQQSVEFLRKNPRLATHAGNLMCALIEVNLVKKQILDLFRTPEVFLPYLDNGTKEELAVFVEDAIASQDTAEKYENLPPGVFDKVKERLGEKALMTSVIAINEPVSKEASELNS